MEVPNPVETGIAFALQVLGLDGVSDGPPPPGSTAARLNEVSAQGLAEGWPQAQTDAALDAVLVEQDDAERLTGA